MFQTAVITAKQLKEALQTDLKLVVFDCQFNLMQPREGSANYAKAHISGARYAHLDHNLSSAITSTSGRHPLPDAKQFANWLGEQGVDNTTCIVAYDEQQNLVASRLWWLARWVGHAKVVVLEGGLNAARAAGIEVNANPVVPVKSEFKINSSLENYLDIHDIETLDSSKSCLIDVRVAARFKGEVEPIDPVAGHIPGALNMPIDLLLDAGKYRDRHALKRLFASQLPVDKKPVFMCGSGVTACQTRLAHFIAGNKEGTIYPGSWSEWIRDNKRPVATHLT